MLKQYQDGMGGVDHGDQYREIGLDFASKSYCKKWYKHVFFRICDFMLLNSYFAWNMSLTDSNVKGQHHMKKDQFYAAIAEDHSVQGQLVRSQSPIRTKQFTPSWYMLL